MRRRGLELLTRYLQPGFRRGKRQDLPGSWRTPSVRSPCSVDAGGTARTRPLRCSSTAPGIRKAKAPTKGLSTLNSMAFGLAVYASQCGLPTPHARLASSRWSDSTGRACHPQGSDERFPSVVYISSSSPKLTWRNRIDRSVGEPPCARRCRRTEARRRRVEHARFGQSGASRQLNSFRHLRDRINSQCFRPMKGYGRWL